MSIAENIIVRQLNLQPYQPVVHAMQTFTEHRQKQTLDELWLVQHYPVFTQGQAGKPEHLLDAGDIPVIQSNRGGQITYHGPGQQIIYTLIDLKRRQLSIRNFVQLIESSVIATLNHYHIPAHIIEEKPGVYVDGNKICSLGLRVRHGSTFHGLALNIDMDLTPFKRINPCGYAEMKMTQAIDLNRKIKIDALVTDLVNQLTGKLGAKHIEYQLWDQHHYE